MGYLFDAMTKASDGDKRRRPPTVLQHAPGRSPPLALPPQVEAAPQASASPAPSEPAAEPPPLDEPISIAAAAAAMQAVECEGIDDRIVAVTEQASVMAEEYRSIRTGLLARWQQRRNLIHTITSATPQEGKTITSLNLGFIFAELRNRRTLVIEADLRLPQFAPLLALPPSPGLVGVLEGEADLKSAVIKVGGNGLEVLPAGRALNDKAVQLLSSAATPALLKRLREKYDHVIIDTPPVLEMADAGILGALSDDVLLIARLERTPRELIDRAIRTLSGFNAPVAGVVATDQKHCRHHNYYKHNSRYGKYYYTKRAA